MPITDLQHVPSETHLVRLDGRVIGTIVYHPPTLDPVPFHEAFLGAGQDAVPIGKFANQPDAVRQVERAEFARGSLEMAYAEGKRARILGPDVSPPPSAPTT